MDAGAHLASIIRVLEQDMPMNSDTIPGADYSKVLQVGPFAGVKFPHISAKANALFILRELLHAFLITHPHLDHVSGMAINTPALEYGREAKSIFALPSTIEAIKAHIFNDLIWPNLSDEGHGVGLVTYKRLVDGGNPRFGHGKSRGYVGVCDGLATKCLGVTHGKCYRKSHNAPHQRSDSFNFPHGDAYNASGRRMSRSSDEHGYMSALAHYPSQAVGGYHAPGSAIPVTPGMTPIDREHMYEPVFSSAFFIRNDVTGAEILIFGDVEPDSVSIFPRNCLVWDDAAPKIAKGVLKAIFIECSYDNDVRDEDLYGHLCPRHLIAELTALAKRVMESRATKISEAEATAQMEQYQRHPSHDLQMKQPPNPDEMRRKRKLDLDGDSSLVHPASVQDVSSSGSPTQPTRIPGPHVDPSSNRAQYSHIRRKTDHVSSGGESLPKVEQPVSPSDRLQRTPRPPSLSTGTTPSGAMAAGMAGQWSARKPQTLPEPLKGLTVHIIHVKDPLTDVPSVGDVIAAQLRKGSEEAGLGCDFDVTSSGESIWI